MKKLCLLPVLFITLVVNAQRTKMSGDPHIIEKFAAEAKINPAYTKLFSQVDQLSKTASPGNTNAAAVRSLLTQNSSLLRGLYTKAGIEAPKAMNAQKQIRVINSTKYRKAMPWNKFKLVNTALVKTELPPYDQSMYMTDDAGLSTTKPDTSTSQFSTGTVRMTYESPQTEGSPRRTGRFIKGYKQSFTVPNDPEIIAAEIRFEYSYLYTGWDTYGAILGMEVAMEINKELNGPDYKALPIYVAPYWSSLADTNHRWKLVADLYPTDTIESDFGEFHGESDHESFTIGGYVTPGKTIDFTLLMGFRKGAKRGANGSYHYAEFILKKITVTYYKSGN